MIVLKLLVYVVIGCFSLCMLALGGFMFAGIPVMDDQADGEAKRKISKPVETPRQRESVRESELASD